MRNVKLSGDFSNEKAKVHFSVGLFQFQEDGVTIIYSPSMDISGYGKSEAEAKTSFQETLSTFLDYALKKDTLVKEFNRLGWQITKADLKKNRVKVPPLADLIQKNDYLAEILNEKQFTKFDQTVTLPAFA